MGKNYTVDELRAAIDEMSDGELDALLKWYCETYPEAAARNGVVEAAARAKEIARLNERITVVAEQTAAYRNELRRLQADSMARRGEEALAKAIAEDRLPVEDRDRWIGWLAKDPEFVIETLNSLPPAVGVDNREARTELTAEEERRAFAIFRKSHPGLSEAQAREEFAKFSAKGGDE